MHSFLICGARRLTLLLGLAMLGMAPAAHGAAMERGSGRFEFMHQGVCLPVWYCWPVEAAADAPVLIVMHGVRRDAERYRDEWRPHAERHAFLLIVPEFSEADFPGTENYSLNPAGAARFIEPLFDAVRQAARNTSPRYCLYGHSAGAQFVHRFLYFAPRARVDRAVAANAGWWTMPDAEVDFPYGLRGAPVEAEALPAALQRRLLVLLGSRDTDPNDPRLRRTPEALRQGPHRLARGQAFFSAARARAAALGVPLRWEQAIAPGASHSNREMAPFAARWLFGPQSDEGRGPAAVPCPPGD